MSGLRRPAISASACFSCDSQRGPYALSLKRAAFGRVSSNFAALRSVLGFGLGGARRSRVVGGSRFHHSLHQHPPT